MKTLHLVLSFKWFDKIKSGEKTKEYRADSFYWGNKFHCNGFLEYDKVRFQRGYTKNPETMLFEVYRIYRSREINDLNLPIVWVIELGKRIQEIKK